MKPCEVCGKSHHAHTENDLSNCLMWANDDNRKLKAEVERLRKDLYSAMEWVENSKGCAYCGENFKRCQCDFTDYEE